MKFRPHPKTAFPASKKAHSAMELITPGGWIMLGIMIVIGILAYMGLFNLENFVPDKCSIGHPLQCTEHDMIRNDDDSISIVLTLQNNGQSFVAVTNLSVRSEVLYEGHCHANSRDFNGDGNASQDDKDNLIRPKGGAKTFVANMLNNDPALKCDFAEKLGFSKHEHEIIVDYSYGDNSEFIHQARGELFAAKPVSYEKPRCTGIIRFISLDPDC